jgi:hypothetical protein
MTPMVLSKSNNNPEGGEGFPNSFIHISSSPSAHEKVLSDCPSIAKLSFSWQLQLQLN